MNDTLYGTERPETLQAIIEGAGKHCQAMWDFGIDDYRLGQAYWNYVDYWHNAVVAPFQATPVDPFHRDERISVFLESIAPFFE